MTTEKESSGKGPAAKYRAGGISCTVWENQYDPKKPPIRNFNLTRSYMDKEGAWQETQSLKTNDLPKAISLLQEAYDEEVRRKKEYPTSA